MTDRISTDLLIVGAGPFGLALAAYAAHLGIDHVVAGSPMSFWREHMPEGMILRSDTDWHLDARDEHTIEVFLAATSLAPEQVRPLSLQTYLQYAGWFQEQKGITPRPGRINALRFDAASGRFLAEAGGVVYDARNVVLAVGFEYFKNLPAELTSMLPESRFGHTCDIVDFQPYAGKDVLIIGGRQSAFETAALIAEAGARSVQLSYRHATPRFETSDWSWVEALMQRFIAEPGWYRRLSAADRADLNARFWAEGRLRLEPWLAPRLDRENVKLWPETSLRSAREVDGRLQVELDSREWLTIDQVILATGYRVDLARVPFLVSGGILAQLQRVDGFPALDDHLESSLPGLYFTSMAATRDFGSFFAFTVSARASARLIGDAVRQRLDIEA